MQQKSDAAPAAPPPGADPARALDPGLYEELVSRVAAWGRGYLESLPDRPVRTPVRPGETLARLPALPPEAGLGTPGFDAVLEDLERDVVPGLVHWQHPGFFAFFPCNASAPAIAAELASATLNTNGMLWATSPAATELEMRMLDWCARLFDLPEAFRFDAGHGGGGVIQATASEATLAALVAARSRAVRAGASRDRVTVYTSTQAHSSVIKAAMIAGLADHPGDAGRVRAIEPDAGLAMDPARLCAAIEADRRSGLAPALVVATLGTTSTGAFDPLADIVGVLDAAAGPARPWLHADAAWAGAALICPEHRPLARGLDRVDSLCINPHKWLLTNFDCDLFWVRSARDLTASMGITPAYLEDAESQAGRVVDYRDWHVPLGRRLRALKLWFVIRHYGAEGLRAHVRRHVALAARIEDALRSDARFELPFPRSLGLVCFRLRGEDARTPRLVEVVNAGGRVLITPSTVPLEPGGPPRPIARISVGTTTTDDAAVATLIDTLRDAAARVVQ
jgi:aromatic-L-amino-acid decarboxylase